MYKPCACGCGEMFHGTEQRKHFNDACRKRAQRAKAKGIIMKFIIDESVWQSVGKTSEHGRSSVDIKCPFCDVVTTASIWSLSANGKLCHNKKCNAHHHSTRSILYSPRITRLQLDAILDIAKGKNFNNKSMRELISKGFVSENKELTKLGLKINAEALKLKEQGK